jgi:hypothetical protein
MLRQKLMGGAGVEPVYVEDVFSTYLYTGNGSTQTITNGIDLAGEGGLVWLKGRTQVSSHGLYDTARGVNKLLQTDRTDAQFNGTSGITSFNASGWTIGSGETFLNNVFQTYASWTFRKQPKFFDVVTYTGNGGAMNIPHSLGSVPGFIVVKAVTRSENWLVLHRNNGTQYKYGFLNSTMQLFDQDAAYFGNGTIPVLPTTTEFTVTGPLTTAGHTYVAYLFAHNAGGFGLTGTDNVISCGSYAGSAGEVEVNLGYEPQWLLIKQVTGTGFWAQMDNMRGIVTGGTDPLLVPNAAVEEVTGNGNVVDLTSTGFKVVTTNNYTFNGAGHTYIYIAIRRGPMKVPTTGTSVFKPMLGNDGTFNTTDFVVDMVGDANQGGSSFNAAFMDRLRAGAFSKSSSTAAETANYPAGFQSNTAVSPYIFSPSTSIMWAFRRAPGFFDEVCYTGTGVARTVAHNLAAVP